MADYIDIDIEDDPAVLTEQITDVIAAAIPNWVPFRTSLVYLLAAGTALIIAELMQSMRALTRAIFSVFGREVVGVAKAEATPSTATATFTSTTAVFEVEAGTLVSVDDGAGGAISFEVVADVSTTDGSAENVQLVSQEVGAYTAGLTLAEPGEALAYDPVVTLTAATSGGTDAETIDAYLPRLSERLQLLADRVILGEDAAILARQVPGVWRAMAVDNYDVDTDDDEAEGKIALALQAPDGGPVSGPVRAAVEAAVIPATILGLAVGFADPAETDIDVRFTYRPHLGYDAADVGARAEANVAAYLARENWGSIPFGNVRGWRPETQVELLEVAEVILRTEGLDRIVNGTLQIRKGGDLSWGIGPITLLSMGGLGPTLPWSVAAPGEITATLAS